MKPRKSKKKKGRNKPSATAPPQDQINLLLTYYQAGSLPETETLATSLTEQFPKHPFGWTVLAAVFNQMGRLTESLAAQRESVKLSPQDAEAHYNLGITLSEVGRNDEAKTSYQKSISLKPDSAEAHFNLGNTLIELGELGGAESSYRKSIALKPEYAQAHSNLGNTLRKLERLDDAEAILRKAVALKPDLATAHNNLGGTLMELGRCDEAILSCVRAINLNSNFCEAYETLGAALAHAQFKEANPDLYSTLIDLLTRGNHVSPNKVAGSIAGLLKRNNLIGDLLLNTPICKDIAEADRAIKVLARVPLLHQLMRVCPLPELDFEALFVSIRRLLLESLGKIEASPETIDFLSTLSLQCFTNEFVYPETDKESELIGNLETAISECLAQASQPALKELLCLAAYRPLHLYDWSERVQTLQQLPEVQSRLLEEPRAEREIGLHVPVLAGIEDSVSRKVREQYESNPYPRWVKLRVLSKAKPVAKFCDEAKLSLHSEAIKRQSSPSILIAGCGTGQHSIETASRFANCQVTAVDLSRSSLAYAQRKTSELGITNIEYLQADILNLGELGRKFDIVESSGVLHHMADPMAGWRVLVDLLKTGGLMKIGLYSELARRHIVMTREEIAAEGIGSSGAEIRQFRHYLAESHDQHHFLLTRSPDFFSLSMLRDLIFHVQEHRFTAIKIQRCLEELGLKFCGFESQDIVSKFRDFFGRNADTCDLALWHQFEESHPRTFAGMYQFWCQKL